MTSKTSYILLVDDEPGIRKMLAQYLSRAGFQVVAADSAGAARQVLAEQPVDLVILDLAMPGEDGLSLARFLRERLDIGIIMLTAAGEVIDRIIGLEMGADDYVSKPFDPRELLARIKGLQRRRLKGRSENRSVNHSVPPQERCVPMGRCILDLDAEKLLTANGEEVPLSNMERDLLQVFLKHPNRILNRDQLFKLAHHRDWNPVDRSIDVRITRLRRKIEINPSNPKTIKTVHGIGYMFVPNAIQQAQ